MKLGDLVAEIKKFEEELIGGKTFFWLDHQEMKIAFENVKCMRLQVKAEMNSSLGDDSGDAYLEISR